jgi:cell surface protein SprA
MTTISLKSAFEGIGSATSGYRSATFERFCRSLEGFRNRVEAQYEGVPYPDNSAMAGKTYSSDNEQGRLGMYSADVMIPAFLSAYTSSGGSALSIFPKLARLLPNWSIRYSGLSQLPWFCDVFKSVNLNHSYKSIYSVGSYSTYSTFQEYMNGLGFINDATQSIPVPSSMFNVSTVSITESFSPLLGIDVTLLNNMTCKLEYRKTRNVSLSMTSVQISEAYSNDWVIGMGYKIADFKLFGGRNHRAVKSNKKGNGADQQSNASQQSTSKTKGISHDLNLRLDLSYRRQASIVRDIATMTSSASSGNTAFKLAFNADYTLSRLLTMSFYYDRQTNTPLLTSSSYPTTTQDFGLSLKFSLTR